MVWTDPGSLSTASVARTHGGGNTPRPATTPGITERNVVGIVTGLITAGDAIGLAADLGNPGGAPPVLLAWLSASVFMGQGKRTRRRGKPSVPG
jgi:hypothetical protein